MENGLKNIPWLGREDWCEAVSSGHDRTAALRARSSCGTIPTLVSQSVFQHGGAHKPPPLAEVMLTFLPSGEERVRL